MVQAPHRPEGNSVGTPPPPFRCGTPRFMWSSGVPVRVASTSGCSAVLRKGTSVGLSERRADDDTICRSLSPYALPSGVGPSGGTFWGTRMMTRQGHMGVRYA